MARPTTALPAALAGVILASASQFAHAAEGEGETPNVETASAYYGLVERIFEERCWSCHNESKDKGDLRMDSFALLMKGGSSGAIVEPGDTEASELWYRITTDDEDDHMPPLDEPQLTEAEIEVVRWWIASGADENRKVGEIERPDPVAEAIAEVLQTVKPKSDEEVAAAKMAAEEKAKAAAAKAERAQEVAALASQISESVGVPVLPIAQGEDRLQFTAVNVADRFDDAFLAKLDPVAGAIADLNLARTKVSDEGLAHIGRMENLERLRLENTAITDAGLAHLEGLGNLEYLNLYGTGISDAGLEQLTGLENLRKLFVWETGVTREGAEKLVAALPELTINLGWDNEVPGPSPEERARAEAEAQAKADEEARVQAQEAARQEAAEAAKQAEELKAQADEAAAKAAALKQQSEEAAQKAEELGKQLEEAAKQADEARRKAEEAAAKAAEIRTKADGAGEGEASSS